MKKSIKKVGIIIAHILVLSVLLAVLFVALMQLAKIIFMGKIEQTFVPWIYLIVYLVDVLIVGSLYLIHKKFLKSRKTTSKDEPY